MVIDQERLLREVMAADFAVIELNLYLDTHPYDQRAIYVYNQSVLKAKMLRNSYERMYGPLTIHTQTGVPYEWVQRPWPWDRRREF